MKRINAINVCGGISFVALIAVAGFLDGGNYIGAVISMVVFAGFAFLAVREDGTFRQKNRPR